MDAVVLVDVVVRALCFTHEAGSMFHSGRHRTLATTWFQPYAQPSFDEALFLAGRAH